MDDVIQCPACCGEAAEYLGELDGYELYLCQHCGTQWIHETNIQDLIDQLEEK